MNKLNKVFEQNQILTAEELNAITGKVDEIVALLSSLGPDNSTITDAQVQAKINAAKEELNQLLNNAIANVQQNLENLRSVVNGKTEVISESEWAQYRAKINETEGRLASMIQLLEGEINVASLRETVDDLNSLIGSLHIEPGKLELIAGLFDENDNLIINPASIIAAIVDNDGKLTSEIAISANQVILDGDVTLTQGLTSMRGEITNLTSSNVTIRSRLTAVEAALGTENGSEEFEKLKDDLEDLTLIVNGKAAIEDLNALAATVGNKTNNSDFQSLVSDINNLSLVVNGKAAIEDLTALTATVGNKTDNSDFQDLVGDLNDLSLVVNGKAAIEDLQALSATVQNINVPDTATITNAVIQQLNVPTTAEIKEAVITDLEAGNVTITGDLHYNRMIGNVESISSGVIPNNAYLVQFTGPITANVSQYPEISLPSNPITGQTIFITVGTKCWKLKANTSIDYFYKDDPLENATYQISSGRASANDPINVFDSDWNGAVEFIYTGSVWQQLIHNIRI